MLTAGRGGRREWGENGVDGRARRAERVGENGVDGRARRAERVGREQCGRQGEEGGESGERVGREQC